MECHWVNEVRIATYLKTLTTTPDTKNESITHMAISSSSLRADIFFCKMPDVSWISNLFINIVLTSCKMQSKICYNFSEESYSGLPIVGRMLYQFKLPRNDQIMFLKALTGLDTLMVVSKIRSILLLVDILVEVTFCKLRTANEIDNILLEELPKKLRLLSLLPPVSFFCFQHFLTRL